MNKTDALQTVRTVLRDRGAEWDRLQRIDNAMRNDVCRVEVPEGSPRALARSALLAETPYLDLAVRTFRQVLKVDGIYLPTSPERAPVWKHWQRNRMDAGQSGIVDSALKYGVAYALVLPGDPGPVSKRLTPRRMTALYQDPIDDEYPMLALDVDGSLMRLYDETSVYYFGIENPARAPLSPTDARNQLSTLNFTYIETRTHNMGVCPVVRFMDQMLLDGEEQYGIVEPLITLQNRITETTFEMLVAQYFAAFRQRYILGWEAKDEAERFKASAASLWTFEDPDVKVGTIEASDTAPYINSRNSSIQDFAANAQLPAQMMGVGSIDNISAEALAGLESSKDRRSSEMKSSLGEGWEQYFRLCAVAEGDLLSADDYESEVRFQDFTARSYAQTVDGLTKIAAALNVPLELIWEDIPGWSQTKVDRAKILLAKGAATATPQPTPAAVPAI